MKPLVLACAVFGILAWLAAGRPAAKASDLACPSLRFDMVGLVVLHMWIDEDGDGRWQTDREEGVPGVVLLRYEGLTPPDVPGEVEMRAGETGLAGEGVLPGEWIVLLLDYDAEGALPYHANPSRTVASAGGETILRLSFRRWPSSPRMEPAWGILP